MMRGFKILFLYVVYLYTSVYVHVYTVSTWRSELVRLSLLRHVGYNRDQSQFTRLCGGTQR